MKTFAEYILIRENVQEKTDLTRWILAIKQTPHNPDLYRVFADYLEERNTEEDQILSQMFRVALQTQDVMRQHGTRLPPLDIHGTHYQEFENLRQQLDHALERYGYHSYVSQIHHPERPVVPNANNTKRLYPDIKSMSMTVDVMNKQGEAKPRQWNNVAWHDLQNRVYQVYSLSRLAERIFIGDLLVGPKPQGQSECDAERLIGRYFGYEARNRLLNGEDINYNPIRRFRDAVEDIRNLMQATWDCCKFWTDQDRTEMLSTLEDFFAELQQNAWLAAPYDALLWATESFIQALTSLVHTQDCEQYQKAIAAILRRIRNRDAYSK